MSNFYYIDSAKYTHRELWWWYKSPTVLIAWMLKWMRGRVPCSSDDPNTESTLPFVVESLPVDVAQHFEPMAMELAGLGFFDPVYHFFHDQGTAATIYWATYRHSTGQHFARIHQRIWHQARAINRGTFVLFFTSFADGTFAASSSGKPDALTPVTVPMLRRQGATPSALWTEHLEFVATNSPAGIHPVQSREGLIDATERHHILLRDFNLERGVFRVRTEAEQASVTAVAARLEEATVGGLRNPAVLAEIERIQTKRPGWGNAIVILVISVFAFLAAGSAQRDWEFYLWLIPLLFLHEGGHWLAMKIFGYRNLRMFFIPLFGAAVTGQNWNVPGWKKAIVSLAGPVPGILLGVAWTIAGLITHQQWLTQAAFLLLIINGFNLLPVLPLDGGHVLHAILFCRNRWLDITFRVLAIVGLLLLSFNGVQFFLYIGIMMAVGLPTAFKIGKVADNLKNMSLPPTLESDISIPLTTADTIIDAVKAELPANTSHKILAQHTINIFETLNARPPGWLATFGFLMVHGGSVLLVAICGMILIVNKSGGGLGSFGQSIASSQPKQRINCDSIERWSGNEADTVSSRNTLTVTLADKTAAKKHFDGMKSHLPPTANLTLMGKSLLLALPATDDISRKKWLADFESVNTNTFVALTNQYISASFLCIMPNLTLASNVTEELTEYFAVAQFGGVVSPWSPQAAGSSYKAVRQVRQTWIMIGTNTGNVWQTAVVKDITKRMLAAQKRGATSEVEQLVVEQTKAQEKERVAIYESLRNKGVDAQLLDIHARLSVIDYTNRVARAVVEQEISRKLNATSTTADVSNKPPFTDGAISGYVSQRGLIVEIGWAGFKDATAGLPAVVDWFCKQGCKRIRFEIEGVLLDSDEEED